jgi:hypothetical protein
VLRKPIDQRLNIGHTYTRHEVIATACVILPGSTLVSLQNSIVPNRKRNLYELVRRERGRRNDAVSAPATPYLSPNGGGTLALRGELLFRAKLNVTHNDLRIAAIATEIGATEFEPPGPV